MFIFYVPIRIWTELPFVSSLSTRLTDRPIDTVSDVLLSSITALGLGPQNVGSRTAPV